MTITKNAPKVDAVLLSMEAECRRLEAATGPKEYRDRMAAKADEIRWKMTKTPAVNSDGMAVKFRVLMESDRAKTLRLSRAMRKSLLADLRG